MPLIEAKQLKKTYLAGDIEIKAIRGVDLTIEPASFVSFIGPSGSGKSTLLNMIGCLDPPTSGQLTVAGQDITKLDRGMATGIRCHGRVSDCQRSRLAAKGTFCKSDIQSAAGRQELSLCQDQPERAL